MFPWSMCLPLPFLLFLFLFLVNSGNAENAIQLSSQRSHPFLSDTCFNLISSDITAITTSQLTKHDIYIILSLKNPSDHQLVIESVKSILNDAKTNYQSTNIHLKHIVIVDDYSDSSISSWNEWKFFSEEDLQIVKFLKYSIHQGKVKAKNGAIKYIQEKYSVEKDSSFVIFMDIPAIVGPRWLFPLTLTINKYEKAMVYPSIDVLSKHPEKPVDGQTSKFIVTKGHDMVAGFNWDFTPKWEAIYDSKRLKYSLQKTIDHSSTEWISPTVPLIFAISWNYFDFLDKFDEIFYESGIYGHENVDLSLRNWLCEGIILQQTCSHVAISFENLRHPVISLGRMITQDHIDKNIINLAIRFLSLNVPEKMSKRFIELHKSGPDAASASSSSLSDREHILHKMLIDVYQEKKLRDISYQKRFLQRIDQSLQGNIDPVRTGPYQSFAHHQKVPSVICNDFDWFLDEIYPGLYDDGAQVMTGYISLHQNPTHYHQLVQQTFTPLIQSFQQAYKEKYVAKILPASVDSNEKEALKEREGLFLKYGPLLLETKSAIQKYLSNPNFEMSNTMIPLKYDFNEPFSVKKYHGFTYDELLEAVMTKNREHLECIDFKDPTSEKFCESTTLNGDPTACQQRKPKVLFTCPKMCGYCDNGKFCEDFYLMKCPTWKQQGMCGKTDGQFGAISAVCRKSCGVCIPDYLKSEPIQPAVEQDHKNNNNNNNNEPVEGVVEDHPVEKPHPPVVPLANPDDPNSLNTMDVNPAIAHQQYLQNEIPDIYATANSDVCHLNDRADGKLLSRVKVHEEYNPLHPNYEIANKIRLFCGIYTIKRNHETNVKATRNTWAKKCDGFIAFSNERDERIPSIDIHHEGPESYENMWQKSRSIWKLIASSSLATSYDFFLLGGDDMFYIIENLRYYLNSPEIMKARAESKGLFLGRIFQPPNQVVFNSGGAGYLLDSKALKVLAENIDTPKCWPHQKGFWEDVNVATCLKNSPENITPYQTRDELQRERFHPFNPGMQLNYRIPPHTPDWYAKYNPDLKIGYECCSEDSISFHYLPEKKLYQLYNYLYHCDKKIHEDV